MKENAEFDVIIAGGGPAGLSALLWCSELGLSAILLEKEPEFGGQLLRTHNSIRNYLGIEAANGRDLRNIFLRQIESIENKRLTDADIVEFDLAQKVVRLGNGEEYSGHSIFIATGVRRRKLNIPGEEKFYGRGILESGVKALEEVSGKTIVIAGGGDAALENAVILSGKAAKIFVIHRRHDFTARREFAEKAKQAGNVEFVFDTQIIEITGDESVNGVELKHLSSGARLLIETDAVLIRIGVEPNTEIFRGQVALDNRGYIEVSSNCATSVSGVFAGGDVTNAVAKTVSTAVGHGSIAAKAIVEEIH
jgi:thioredoxin reductase (NADPH)